ncbi:hypothetical protein F5051DRAFT_482987 [Lentinula edodes]|nr:hypothetical protein F5051DRAFT_482987 [Lentinula edodes]
MSLIIGGHNASAAFDPSIFYSAISRPWLRLGHPIRRSPSSPGPHVEALLIYQKSDNVGYQFDIREGMQVSFRLFAGGCRALTDIAYLIGCLAEGLIRDQEPANLSGISYCTASDYCFGYMIFLSISESWYKRAATTPFLEPWAERADTYIGTWPLFRDEFCTNTLIRTTMDDVKWRRVSEVRTKQDGHLDHHDEHDDQHRQQQTPERRTKKQHVVSPSRSPAPVKRYNFRERRPVVTASRTLQQRGQPTTPTTTTRRSTDNANNNNKEVEVEVEDEVEAVYPPSLSRNIVSGAVAGTVVVVVSSLPWAPSRYTLDILSHLSRTLASRYSLFLSLRSLLSFDTVAEVRAAKVDVDVEVEGGSGSRGTPPPPPPPPLSPSPSSSTTPLETHYRDPRPKRSEMDLLRKNNGRSLQSDNTTSANDRWLVLVLGKGTSTSTFADPFILPRFLHSTVLLLLSSFLSFILITPFSSSSIPFSRIL